jgi:hypothetical protein
MAHPERKTFVLANLGKPRRRLRDGASRMHEKTIEIRTVDGRMETFITHPEKDGPFAPLVIYMDVWDYARSSTTSPARWRCRLT